MQHVKTKWLFSFTYSLAFIDILFFVVFAIFSTQNVPAYIVDRWGITPLILVFAGIHLVYSLFVFPFLQKKVPWIASLVSIVLFGLLLAGIIQTSGNTNLVYRLGLAVFVFFTAITGPFIPIAIASFAWLLLIFTLLSLTSSTHASVLFNVVMDIIVTIAALSGWQIFKKYYVSTKTPEMNTLSNLLEEEQLKSSVILESITDGVLVVNAKGIIKITNAAAAQMFGWSKEEVIGLDFHSLLKPLPSENSPDEPAEDEAISATLKTGQATQRVNHFETLHNRQLYIDVVASPIYMNNENQDSSVEKQLTGVIAVLRNVDRQKREEQQRSDFISTASHEMRTPVASIQGYLELALNPKISQLEPKTKMYLDKAYEATKHLGQLFQDLLTVSRSEDGRLVNHPDLVDINKLITDVVDQQKKRAADKGLLLSFESDDTQGLKKVAPILFVKADPDRLREVILNLVENAIKYTPKGSIKVGADVDDQNVKIHVSDTGTGIAEEDLPHLFQKFYRVDNSATREIGGTGLGLFISKQIIELLGGRVWVESKLNEGSSFFIELPRVNPSDPEFQTPPAS